MDLVEELGSGICEVDVAVYFWVLEVLHSDAEEVGVVHFVTFTDFVLEVVGVRIRSELKAVVELLSVDCLEVRHQSS
jgi:hypothetical protein